MRQWIIALALFVSFVPAAFAGGLHARIEGTDGLNYTARVQACDPNTTLEPWALAEGVVDGKRMSRLITLKATSERGVYQFTRNWPENGLWMIRFNLGHPPAPATVAALRADGSVKSNRLHWKTDGSPECHKALRHALKPLHGPHQAAGSDEGC